MNMQKLDSNQHQIDFKTNDGPPLEVMEWIKHNSTRVQHLLDEEPRLSRWWFNDIGTAMKAVNIIMEKCPDVEYRWLCIDLNALVMQHGDF
ncbi:MAG: hypothetical protein ABGX00_00645 [Allomuricauda sp.]|jgi:hypothetical protein